MKTLVPCIILLVLAHEAQAQLFAKRPRQFPVGPNPSYIVAQDITDDGLPEIVTADRGELGELRDERPANDELTLLVAGPGLEYVPHRPSLKSGFGPYAIALANIDALKWPDIIVVNFHAVRPPDISLFLNLHSESIFEAHEFDVPAEGLSYARQEDGDGGAYFSLPSLSSLVVHDFNQDGIRDVLATGWASDVLVYIPGHPEKYFDMENIRFIPARGGPSDVQMMSLDGDGHRDLVVTMYASEEVTLWRGDGTGNFTETDRFQTLGRLPHKTRVGDINRDGIDDLAVSHRYADDSITLFYGDGNSKYSVAQALMFGEDRHVLEHEIRDFVLEDLDGDGWLDLAAACYASGKVIVQVNASRNNGFRQTFGREVYSFDNGRPRALCTADFDQNGERDLAVALGDANAVALLINR